MIVIRVTLGRKRCLSRLVRPRVPAETSLLVRLLYLQWIVKVVNVITGADGWAVVEFLNRGTQTGPLHASLADFPPSGRKVEVHYCSVIRVQGGKVVEGRDDYDSASIARHLGLVA